MYLLYTVQYCRLCCGKKLHLRCSTQYYPLSTVCSIQYLHIQYYTTKGDYQERTFGAINHGFFYNLQHYHNFKKKQPWSAFFHFHECFKEQFCLLQVTETTVICTSRCSLYYAVLYEVLGRGKNRSNQNFTAQNWIKSTGVTVLVPLA